MSLRFASLGSGSRGNATLVECAGTRILVDCGFSVRETELRLARLGLNADDLSALLVTHEHEDHVRGVRALSRKYNVPVRGTHGTGVVAGLEDISSWQSFDPHTAFVLGELEVQPVSVPHDAREPCQYIFSDGVVRLAVITDLGSSTPYLEQQLSGCHGLLLECNHDSVMLSQGQYPPSLKARVGGRLGHLSNAQAAELLASIDVSCLRYIAGMHLSEKNNRPELAQQALCEVLYCQPQDIALADQQMGLAWQTL